jgi:hypothetical protein
MALWIAEAGLSIARYYFFLNLLAQLSNPDWPTSQDYVYSPDFMWNSGVTYSNGVEKPIPSACAGGPSGQCKKLITYELLLVTNISFSARV